MISARRLAWLQLRAQKVRLLVAIAGVAFAVLLMLMQYGFEDALFRSSVAVHSRLRGDLFFVHANYNVLALPSAFPRARLYQALGFAGVASVEPVYTAIVPWKNPDTGNSRQIFLMGIDPSADVFDGDGDAAARRLLQYPDVVLYDALSRPEFGPIAARFARDGEVSAEVLNRRVTVRGLFSMGTSFGVDGTVFTSDLNYLRINPFRTPAQVGIGLVRLVPGADPQVVQAALRAHLPHDVQVLTKAEMLAHEIRYWASGTPIGFVFTFGVIMGLVVGMIIVYQILFADIADHLKEYATLKAMGYGNRYLAGVVLMEAAILAAVGFVPAVGLCTWLYAIAGRATGLPMTLAPARAALVFALTLVMCWGSALLAIRKLRAADPADVF